MIKDNIYFTTFNDRLAKLISQEYIELSKNDRLKIMEEVSSKYGNFGCDAELCFEQRVRQEEYYHVVAQDVATGNIFQFDTDFPVL